MGCCESKICFQTNKGVFSFDICDTAGDPRFRGSFEEYCQNAECAIIMFDLTSQETYENVASYYNELKDILQKVIPFVLVGNKAELNDNNIPEDEITFHHEHDAEYVEISAKTSYHLEDPFLALLRKITNDPDLQLSIAPPLLPPDIPFDVDLDDKF